MYSLRLAFSACLLAANLGVPLVANAEATTSTDPLADIQSEGIIFAGSALCGTGSDPNACEDCRERGNCTLEQVLQVFVNLANFTLGISGTVLLFVFIYGGFKWLMSRGDPKWVESGRSAMTGGIVGIVIVFGSYVAINFILAGLKTGDAPTTNLENTLKAAPDGGSAGSTNVPFTTK